jgi:hypothetical protein
VIVDYLPLTFLVLAGARSLKELKRIEPKAQQVYMRYLGHLIRSRWEVDQTWIESASYAVIQGTLTVR